ncbi:MAG: hypothetical protein Q8O64_19955 [Sideroxyarcus sp.]|nr:hypothetical protein [Sideroxyarcus sp.]
MGHDQLEQQNRLDFFPQDGFLWRIEWLDHISYSIDDSPKIRVFLSRIKEDTPPDRALYNSALYKDESGLYIHKFFDTKIGFIQLLKIGSVWRNRFQLLEYRASEYEFSFSLKDTRSVQINKDGSSGQSRVISESVVTNKLYQVANNEARHGSFVIILENIINKNNYWKIFIPSSVIFQSCYVTSPKAAEKIIFGQLDKLIDLTKSGFIVDEPNVYKVVIHRDYKDVEGTLLANLATDPAAQATLEKLRKNLVMQSVAMNTGQLIPLFSNFPFSNDVAIKVLGKRGSYGEDEWCFFVSEITSIRTDFQFDTIVLLRKNSGEKGKEVAEELRPSYEGVVKTPSNNGPDATLLTQDIPSNLLKPNQINIPLGIDINHIKVVKEEKQIQHYINASIVVGSDEMLGGVESSPGHTTSTPNGISETTIVATPASLEEFFKVLNFLKAKFPNIKTLEICRSTFDADGNGILNYFPNKISKCYSWHLTADKQRTRSFIIASLQHAGSWYYLIDVEPKNKGVLSIAVIRPHDGNQLTTSTLHNFMLEVVRENGWGAFSKEYYVKNWKHKNVDHNRGKEYKNVANNICKAIAAI